MTTIRCDYDELGDVLYLKYRWSRIRHSEPVEDGYYLVISYNKSESIVGFLLMGASFIELKEWERLIKNKMIPNDLVTIAIDWLKNRESKK